MTEFKKQEHIDILKQMVGEELHEFNPDNNSASDLRYKANLIEMNEIPEGKDPLDEIFVEKIAEKPQKSKIKTQKKGFKAVHGLMKYTPEVIRHIKMIKKTMNITQMVEHLNKKFDLDTNENRLAVALSQRGIKLDIKKKHTPIHPKAGTGRPKLKQNFITGVGGAKMSPVLTKETESSIIKFCSENRHKPSIVLMKQVNKKYNINFIYKHFKNLLARHHLGKIKSKEIESDPAGEDEAKASQGDYGHAFENEDDHTDLLGEEEET